MLYGFVGLIVGVALALLAGSDLATPPMTRTALDRLGWWAAVVFPLAYGIVGGIVGAVGAVLYNFAAGVTGGVRVELRERGSDREGASSGGGGGTAAKDAG